MRAGLYVKNTSVNVSSAYQLNVRARVCKSVFLWKTADSPHGPIHNKHIIATDNTAIYK